MRQFVIRIQTKEPNDTKEIWDLADEIEKQTGLMIYWTVVSHFPGLYFLEGQVLKPAVERPRRSGRVKLTGEEIASIRRLNNCGVSQVDLAYQFGTSQSLISLIVRRKRRVDGEY
jgi:hypothetical protein